LRTHSRGSGRRLLSLTSKKSFTNSSPVNKHTQASCKLSVSMNRSWRDWGEAPRKRANSSINFRWNITL
jgi:hypothetical protein